MGAIRHQVVVRGGRRHRAPSAVTGTIDEMLFDLPRTNLRHVTRPDRPLPGNDRPG